MIISKVLFPIFLFVTSALAEKVYDPCSEFLGYSGTPMVKCPSEKPDDYYLECYDLAAKEYMESRSYTWKNWCWSRQDNNDIFTHLTISAGFYDNSNFNDIINRPFTASFFVNETHIVCLENEKWWSPISFHTNVDCPISTGIPVADFHYTMEGNL